MKHILTLIDKILDLLGTIPRTVDSDSDKDRANKIVDKLIKYTNSLEKLIKAHRDDEYMQRLHSSSISQVKGFADEVENLFRDLISLLDILKEDAKDMKKIVNDGDIEDRSKKWCSAVAHLNMGVLMLQLNKHEKRIQKFLKIKTFQEHELRKIIDCEDHVVELLA
ncbi:hypothetical protein HOK51_07255 [Candidatus Woesearchaeota archaeon]|jgi:hypothetical protein|nr:hypothetical protein [Candidatus Woesearchaeota archaeon]MBT6519619.1 hypothetical protein [Candidatus Woesearchaeota archaeon]MBT7367534.1 hypothetical protein [Candidatus Woesearchaeota archaeon]